MKINLKKRLKLNMVQNEEREVCKTETGLHTHKL